MNKKISITAFLQNTFLFKGLDEEQIESLIQNAKFDFETYMPMDIISSPDEHKRRIGFVISGECVIERRNENEGVAIPLNKITTGDAFGILNVFSSDNNLPTSIRALKECRVIFIDEETLIDFINKSSFVAMNIIKFMGDRISFLNKKISTFSPNNTRQKVANCLYYLSQKNGDNFKLNCQRTAATLNIGRASLYRSIDSLVEDRIIDYKNGTIKILDKNRLERISK